MSERIFHVLVVAPLHAGEDHAMNDAWPAPLRFERATFDDTMAGVAPKLAIDVPGAGAGSKPQRVEITLPKMRSFRPDVLLNEIAELAEAAARDAATRGVLASSPSRGAGGAEVGSLVDDILSGMGAATVTAGSGAGASGEAEAMLAAIVHHPEVRRLERAWRGLHFLTARSDQQKVIVEAIHAHAGEVDAILERVARRTDAPPFDLIVVDHQLDASPRDLGRMESWATLAERIGAPLVTNGVPELVGEDSLAMLGRTQRRLRSSDDPRAAAVRNVAARDAARWIAIALNGPIARPKHAGVVKGSSGVALDEEDELYMGAAHLVASLACKSFADTGWACALSGPAHGVVRELPVRKLDDRGAEVATPLEALATETTAVEAAAAGVILFASVVNADVAILPRAPVLFRPASTGGGTSAAAALGLADQLFVAYVAQAVVQLAAAIPRDTPSTAACEVARLALADLFGAGAPTTPPMDVLVTGSPPVLEVTVRPRGFLDVRLEEATLAAALA